MYYLDNSATTKLSENVKNDIISNLENFGNPSSIYDIGFKTQDIIQKARENVAKCINADVNEIYFTSGASESNTWSLQQPFWCEDYEHHSITNNPLRTKDIYKAKIIEQMYVNNEIGFINDIKGCREYYKNWQFHCDATQAMSCIKIDVKDLGVDTLSFSGHKINAPKGVGVLYIRNGIKLKPLIYGGKQEKGIRGGTENVLGISH
jgi:Cysteine sulfinate desulfinase/cysteine desulfurase and related enzymes